MVNAALEREDAVEKMLGRHEPLLIWWENMLPSLMRIKLRQQHDCWEVVGFLSPEDIPPTCSCNRILWTECPKGSKKIPFFDAVDLHWKHQHCGRLEIAIKLLGSGAVLEIGRDLRELRQNGIVGWLVWLRWGCLLLQTHKPGFRHWMWLIPH